MVFRSSVSWRYLFTLELPEYWENKQADQTLEVLMSDLDPAVMDQFYMKDGVSANDVTRVRFTFNTSALQCHFFSLIGPLVKSARTLNVSESTSCWNEDPGNTSVKYRVNAQPSISLWVWL